MKITIDIQDTKAVAFINFIKSLDFMKIQTSEDSITTSKEEILRGIENGYKEAQLHSEGKIKL